MKYLIKRALRPAAIKPLRRIYDRVRSIQQGSLNHQRIAELVDRPGPVILEIGCNDGQDTVEFLRWMPDAKIYCFEPDRRAAARFKQRLGNRSSVELFECAVSEKTGEIDFHISTGDERVGKEFDQSGSIRTPKNHLTEAPWVRFESVQKVKTCRLDDWCADNDVTRIDFIWMDAQGAEGDIVLGGKQALRFTRFLYTEYSNNEVYAGQPSLGKLLSLLPEFEVVARYPGDILLRNKYFD